MNESIIVIAMVICTAVLSASFYAGCNLIAGGISGFTISIINKKTEDKAEDNAPEQAKETKA